jgi:iron complex transport system substrate-binding protein
VAVKQVISLARPSTRRQSVAAASGLLASLPFITRVGAQTEATPGASPAAGGFTFTDDKGVTVTLPERPTVIVADVSAAAPLWDFGIRPVAVSGWTAGGDGYNAAAWGNIDQDAVDVINGEKPLPDPEKLLALAPDLFVTITWDPADPANYWGFEDADEIERVRSIVPIVAISATGSAAVSTERFAELAAA